MVGGPLIRSSLIAACLVAGCEAPPIEEHVSADTYQDVADTGFQPTGSVTDAANIFDENAEERLTAKLADHNASARHPIVVATVPSLNGESAQDFADELANRWKVGQDNRGVFLLIAPNEGEMWMSVADGTLPRLPNAQTQKIVGTLTIPPFSRGDFYRGTEATIDAVISRVSSEARSSSEPTEPPPTAH